MENVAEISLKDKIPPQNLEAEQAVLGAILVDHNGISNVISTLKADRFYSLRHQIIFDAMVKLYTKNISIDSVSLSNQLI